jgi:ATP-dependent DNA helicase RecQ
LARIRAVSRLKLGACSGIAEAYAPGVELLRQWGSRLEFMQPVGDCGRCPACRHRGLPVFDDPAPAPVQAWAVETPDLSELERFAASCRGQNGCAVLTYVHEDDAVVAGLAAGLIQLGVGHVGGLSWSDGRRSSAALFVDASPLSPVDLSPASSFSYFAPGEHVSRRWLGRREAVRKDQRGRLLVDILLMPESQKVGGRSVGRDIPSLPAATALELLPRS